MEGTVRHPAPSVRAHAPAAVPSYRPDIQGLRAVAVLLVVAGHVLGVPRGGYVGVDVFFVISGFLITGLLLREHARTGRVSLREFYARRARRLLPAAVLALAATNLAAWLVFRGERAGQTLTDAAWALGFLANVRFAAIGTDYFDEARPPSPVQHYWSLAVEEQYYLLWPWLLLGLLLLLRRRRRALFPVVLALVAAAVAWSLVATASDSAASYFSTPARAWELGIGALLALALHLRLLPVLERWAGACLSWLGLAMVTASALLYGATTPFPGSAAALPVVGAACVLLGGTTGGRNPVLVNPAAEYVGRISYSLYLWHWPAVVLGGALLPEGPVLAASVLAVAFALAIACHHLVEEPVRRSDWLSRRPARDRERARRRTARTAVSLGAAAALLLGAGGLAAVALRSDPPPPAAAPQPAESTPELDEDIAASVSPASWPALEVPLETISRSGAPEWVVDRCDNVGEGNLQRCVYGDPDAPRTAALVGDSMAISWLPALRALLEPRGWKIHVLTRNQCPLPRLQFFRSNPAQHFVQCTDHKAWAFDQVRQLRQDLVVASKSITFLDHQMGQPTGEARFTAWRDGLALNLGYLATRSERVVVLGPPPRAGNLQSCVTRVSAPADCTTELPREWADLRAAEQAAAARAGAEHVDVEPLFCSGGRCPAVVGSTPVYTDGRHLTAAYARRLGPPLGELLGLSDDRAPAAAQGGRG